MVFTLPGTTRFLASLETTALESNISSHNSHRILKVWRKSHRDSGIVTARAPPVRLPVTLLLRGTRLCHF